MSPPAVDAGSPIAIREFQFEGQGVRTASKPTGTEFVAVDVCGVLGHSNSRMALKRLHPSEKGVSVVYTPGGMQEVATVTESGLYALILSSRKPQALRFRLWVTSVVLPAIAGSACRAAVLRGSWLASRDGSASDVRVSPGRGHVGC